MKNNAYTLAEMMLVLCLVGILALFSIGSIRAREDKFAKMLYNKAHYNLITVVYNIPLEIERKMALDNPDPNLKFMEDLSDKEFCNELAGWFNVVPSTNNCNDDSIFVGYSGNDLVTKNEKGDVPPNYKFVTTNGVNWFMSPMFKEKLPKRNPADVQRFRQHRVIWIDINGSYGFNTADCSNNLRCDRFAFDIVNNDRTYYVLPLGFPKLDRGYARAVIKYPIDLDHPDLPTTEIGSYYQEQCAAFGCFEGTDENGKTPKAKGVPRFFDSDLYSSVPENVTDENDKKPFATSSLLIPDKAIKDSSGKITKLGLDLYYRDQDFRCKNGKTASNPKCAFELEF